MSTVAEQDRSTETVEEVHLLDLVAVILKRWRAVVGTLAGTVAAALIAALLLPRTYTAHTVLLTASSQSPGGAQAIAAQLSGLPLPGLSGGASSDQRLIGVLAESRLLADSMVSRLRRQEGAVPEGEVRRVIGQGTEVKSNPDGSVAIQVEAEDPELATSIANAFPAVINRLTADIGAQAARRKQEFLEARLEEARDQLIQSEQAMVQFQRRQGTPDLPDQARRTLDAASQLQQRIMEQEIRVAQLRRSATSDNPALQAAIAELNAYRGQLGRLTTGTGSGSRIFPSLGESPDLKLTAARMMREFTKNEQVYVSLTAALADAQIEAHNSLPVITVLDAALIPSVPSAPNVRLILALALVLGLILGLIAAFAREAAHRARQNPENESFFAAWRQFKKDVGRYSPRRRNRRVTSSVRPVTE